MDYLSISVEDLRQRREMPKKGTASIGARIVNRIASSHLGGANGNGVLSKDGYTNFRMAPLIWAPSNFDNLAARPN